MCGILGIKGKVFDTRRFIDALNLQSHRGPDDFGYFQEHDIQLGHRRLSIIDLHKHSRQPMHTENGDLVCIFNGEIYNYREIRDELERLGYRFHTSSDTEVLLKGFHYFGKKVLDHLIGMFAFAIHDRRNNSLFLARDRLGIKPLFYTRTSRGLLFSSEIKSLRALDDAERSINETAVSSFLSFRYPILNDTFYQGIVQLPPGHFMAIDDKGNGEPQVYWSVTDTLASESEDRGEAYYLHQLERLFSSAVSYRMIADVAVGGYLSGGVDSSAVVAEMAGFSDTPVKTFTIGFEEDQFNEFEYARIVANRYQTEHHEILLSKGNYLDTMQELIAFKDAPLGVPNEVPLYRMSQTLKQHITVVLSGEGADEIFGGYGRIFRSADDFEKIQCCHKHPESCSPELLRRIHNKYGNKYFNDEVEHFLHLYRYTSLNDKARILHPRFSQQEAPLEKRFRQVFDTLGERSYREKMLAAFEILHLPGLLQRVDTTTMAASVEARVPFVDHRLVEFAFTIPDKYKLKWKDSPECCQDLLGDEISEVHDIPKYILKKAMSDKLPDSILYRRKMGFPVPLERWFGSDFRRYATEQILHGELQRREILDHVFVKDFLASDAIEKDAGAAKTAWMLLSLELFLQAY